MKQQYHPKNRKDFYIYINKMNYSVICEVGIRYGKNFDDLMKSNPKTAFAVDCWENTDNVFENDISFTQQQLDNQYHSFVNRYKNDNRVVVLRRFSVDAACPAMDIWPQEFPSVRISGS